MVRTFMMYQKTLGLSNPGILQIYLVGYSLRVSFKWVVLISTKQEAAHTQSAKVSTCYTLWSIVGNYRPVGILIVYVTIRCPPSRHLRGTGA